MTPLGTNFLFIAGLTGGYALVMLIDGQLTDFVVAASICVGAVLLAGLIEFAVRRSRNAIARRRATVWHRREWEVRRFRAYQFRQLCGGARRHELPSRLDPHGLRLRGACTRAVNQQPAP